MEVTQDKNPLGQLLLPAHVVREMKTKRRKVEKGIRRFAKFRICFKCSNLLGQKGQTPMIKFGSKPNAKYRHLICPDIRIGGYQR